MKTQLWAITLVVLATFGGSWGALLLKMSVDEIHLSLRNILRSRRIILSVTLYVLSSLPFIWALRGGELSVLCPMGSLSYVWITGISHIFLKEQIGLLKIIGVSLIVIGVVVIGVVQ
jgi:uncharacterized membrane protein